MNFQCTTVSTGFSYSCTCTTPTIGWVLFGLAAAAVVGIIIYLVRGPNKKQPPLRPVMAFGASKGYSQVGYDDQGGTPFLQAGAASDPLPNY